VKAGSYDAAARRLLENLLRDGAPLRCPSCDVELASQRVEPARAVAYVRRRVLVICPSCHRSAGLDVKRTPRRAD
jgi:uncharacterized protein with PIN domain